MELVPSLIIGVVVIAASTVLARRLSIAGPLVLVAIGLIASLFLPAFAVEPEIILAGVLPPLLFAAAVRVPAIEFRRDALPISGLAVVLVVVSALVLGAFFWWMLPDLDFALAVALGAILSPTDAVATSIVKRLGISPRVVVMLEGESLLNDATALVLLRSAVAAAAGGLATPWEGVLDFVYAVLVAVVIGLIAGIVTVWVRSKLDDPVLDTAVSLAVPFVAFMPAEELHASGVLAVVIAGLYTGHAAPSTFTPQSRISDRINWRTVQFLLENGVFLLIGLEIRNLVNDVEPTVLGVWDSIGIGLIATLALVVIRYLWIGPLVAWLGRRSRRAEKRTYQALLALYHYRTNPVRSRREAIARNKLERDYTRRRADLETLRQEHIDWRGGVVLGWSGMRGVVTLAAAQSLPEETPYRPQLILIAFTVAVVSIVVQGGTLPALIKALKLQGVDADEERRELASLLEKLSAAGLDALDEQVAERGDELDPEVVERARQNSFLLTEAAWERAGRRGADNDTPHRIYRELRLAIVAAEREKMLELRAAGVYPSRILAEAQTMLDAEETRLQRRSGGGGH